MFDSSALDTPALDTPALETSALETSAPLDAPLDDSVTLEVGMSLTLSVGREHREGV
jgi:hypothetical protein